MSYRYPTVLYNRKIDWDEPIPYSYAEINYKKDKIMAKDVDGKELKVGDTVEVIDGNGASFFVGKKGKQFTIVEIKDRGGGYHLVYVEDIITGDKHGQLSHRFKRIDKMTYKVGTKLKYKYTDYFVEYANAEGVLLYYNSPSIKSKYYYFVYTDELKDYSEIKPEQWVYLWKNSYGEVQASSVFTSKADADKFGRESYGAKFISVVRTDKTE